MIGIPSVDVVSATGVAAQGLRAQRTRINVIAMNIANALSTRTPEGGAFRRQLAVLRGNQLTPLARDKDFGVKVARVVTDPSPLRMVYNPGHPDANGDGYVQYPNVDVAVEMADLVSAQRAYEANVAVIVSGKRIRQKALEILQA
jgi:flagellar basal-body rod protein FlgC